MSQFYYKALKNQKEIVTGYVEADNVKEARSKVRDLGFLPTNIYEEFAEPTKSVKANPSKKKYRLSLADKILFTSELQTLLSSSISTLEALESIAKYSPKENISNISLELENNIKTGETFSDALDKYSDVFGKVYTALVKAGQMSGTLPTVLGYLLNLLKKQEKLKDRFIQMSIYPMLLVAALIGMYFLAGGLIFPKLIYAMSIDNPPIMVYIVVDSVSFCFKYWWFLIILGAAGVYGTRLFFDDVKIKEKISNFLMKVPVLSDCIQYFSLAHYMAVMQISYDAGVPMLDALQMAEGAIGNTVIQKRAKNSYELVKKGKSLTESYQISGLMPPMLMPVVATGEKTGKLGQMFRDAVIGIEQKLDVAIGALAKAFEPTIIIILAIFVGYIVVAFMQLSAAGASSILNAF